MPAALADSVLYGALFADPETAALFSDTAEIRAMLRVEGALAQVQGRLGLIPAEAGAHIAETMARMVIDPAALAAATATNGVPVPGLLDAIRTAMDAPEQAQYLHWGATSQDIMDTALMLRLRDLFVLFDARLADLLARLGALAQEHAELPMAARTYGQLATPTSFGAVVASWGFPLLNHRARLAALRDELACVSLSGAAGTLSAMGADGPQVRAELAHALDLHDPGHSWHSQRDGIGALAAALAGLAASLGKFGEDLILASQSGIGEIAISGAGGSSTMPQKQNPVGPSVLVALARQAIALAGVVQGAGLHRQQRDGAAWFAEWLTLPQLCISTGRALSLAIELAGGITPNAAAMADRLDNGPGLIHAEAFSFALARRMPRPEAQQRIKQLCDEALATGTPLAALIARDYPGLATDAGHGSAADDARAFARATGVIG